MTADTPAPVDHDAIRAQAKAHPAGKGVVFNVAVTVLEVGGSILAFQLARSAGASDVAAYLWGSVAPVLGGLVVWIRAKKFSGASAALFAFTALSAVVAVVGSTDSKVLLYKDCAVTGLIGLIFLASCVVMPRPVVFYFAQRYGTDGTREGMSVFDQMWRAYPIFRRSMYLTSAAWGVCFLVQAAVTALIVATQSFSTAYTWDQILPFVATAIAVAISVVVGKRARAQGEAARRAGQAEGRAAAG